MKRTFNLLAIVLVATLVLTACSSAATPAPAMPASTQKVVTQVVTAPPVMQTVEVPVTVAAPTPTGKQLVIYMQMGGNQGDPSTLARTNGAEAAAKALNIKLIEQYSGWDPNKMIDQFKQAMAASPDGIIIMGHPGDAAFDPLIDQAEAQGIIVTSGNNPLPTAEAKYKGNGFGYAGANLHDGGFLTGQAMIAAGLKSGDEAVVYDIWHNASRSVSSQGIVDALTAAGVKVDKLDVTDAVDADALPGHPDPDCLYCGPSQPESHWHPARQRYRRPGESSPGRWQETRRYHLWRY